MKKKTRCPKSYLNNDVGGFVDAGAKVHPVLFDSCGPVGGARLELVAVGRSGRQYERDFEGTAWT